MHILELGKFASGEEVKCWVDLIAILICVFGAQFDASLCWFSFNSMGKVSYIFAPLGLSQVKGDNMPYFRTSSLNWALESKACTPVIQILRKYSIFSCLLFFYIFVVNSWNLAILLMSTCSFHFWIPFNLFKVTWPQPAKILWSGYHVLKLICLNYDLRHKIKLCFSTWFHLNGLR